MAGLLDGLQGGGAYPAVAPTGRNLFDILRGAVVGNPDDYAAADAAAQAQAQRYAAAQAQADSNLAAAMTPVANKVASGTGVQPYAMGTPDPTIPAQLPGSGAPMGFGGAGGQGAPSASVAAAPTAPAPAPRVAAARPSVVSNPGANPIISATGGAPEIAPGVVLNDDGSDPNAAPADPATSASAATTDQLQQAVQSPEESQSLLQGFADQARGVADKLTHLSPNASQALIATGLATLAANDGSRNLGQVLGIGGAAGLNNYQTNVQNQARNQLAATKLQQDQYLKLRQQALEEAKYQNTPTKFEPGSAFITPGMIQRGIGPQPVGGTAVKDWKTIENPDGSKINVGYDYAGNEVARQPAGQVPLSADQSKAISDAVNEQNEAALTVGHTQNFLKQLSKTMIDPQTGKEVANPNYVEVPGGLWSSAQNAWTHVTGDMTQGQQLRQQIMNSTVLGQLGQYKAGVGGRLTNADINILSKNVPPEAASGETLYKYLAAYGRLQADAADRAALKSAYLQQNRGQLDPLKHDLTVGGITYPAGSTWDQVANLPSYKGPPVGRPAAQGTSSQGGSAQSSGNMGIAGIQAIARGNGPRAAEAQAALKQRGLSW